MYVYSCSKCGYVREGLLDKPDYSWNCPKCGRSIWFNGKGFPKVSKEPYEKPSIQSKPAYFCYDCLNLDPTDCDPAEVGHYCGLFKQSLTEFPNRLEKCMQEFGYISLEEEKALHKDRIRIKRFTEFLCVFNVQKEKDIAWLSKLKETIESVHRDFRDLYCQWSPQMEADEVSRRMSL